MSKFLIAALALILLGLAIYSPNIVRLYKLANLYNEKSISKNLRHLHLFLHQSNHMFLKKRIMIYQNLISLRERN